MILSPLLADGLSAGSVFLLLYCGLGLGAFLTLATRVFTPGGARVSVEGFGAREAGLAAGVCVLYGMLGAAGYAAAAMTPAAPPTISLRGLIFEVALQGTVLVVVISVLARRGPLSATLGLGGVPWWRAALLGLGFLVLLYPVVLLAAQLTMDGEQRTEDLQPLVRFFQSASWRERSVVAFSAVVVAPVVEEIIFRGLIYGAAKRFGGPAAAAIFSSAFFAFIHGNVPALGPLFGLALCLVLAYEFTGSLLVPIALHVWFNSFNLLAMALDTPK